MPVTGIGEELRRERLRQGFTLDDIAQRTKIPARSLEAIEADAFDRLPGIVFARGFVRLYANDLKLDPEALVSQLPRVDIETTPLPNPPVSGRTKWDPRLTAALASVLWLVTAAGAGAGAWYYFNHYVRHSATTVASAPAPVSSPAVPTRSAKSVLTANESAPAPGAPGEALPEGFDGNRPVQVVLTAHEAVWVQVSADGRQAFEGILKPNEKRAIAADAQVKIWTGNAGGLDISLNGKPLDPIGPSGQVRTVRLTAEGPQFVPQNPPASSPL